MFLFVNNDFVCDHCHVLVVEVGVVASWDFLHLAKGSLLQSQAVMWPRHRAALESALCSSWQGAGDNFLCYPGQGCLHLEKGGSSGQCLS